MKLTQVKKFNEWARNKGKYILIFTLGVGSMQDKPRKYGWVVSGYSSKDSHQFFLNKKEAINFIKLNKKKDYYFGVKATEKHDSEVAVIKAKNLEQAKQEFSEMFPEDINNIDVITSDEGYEEFFN